RRTTSSPVDQKRGGQRTHLSSPLPPYPSLEWKTARDCSRTDRRPSQNAVDTQTLSRRTCGVPGAWTCASVIGGGLRASVPKPTSERAPGVLQDDDEVRGPSRWRAGGRGARGRRSAA